MTVRFLTADDLDDVLEFQRCELQGSRRPAFMPDSVWEKSARDQSTLISVNELGEIDGFSKFKQDDNELRVLYLHAAREKRGEGIGKRLLAEVVKIAEEQGKSVTLSVSPSNETAIGLYTQFGFAVDHSVKEDPDMAGLSTHMIRKPSSDFSP